MKNFFRDYMSKKVENFSEDFFGEHTIHLEIFYFEHSVRFFVPQKLFCSPTAMQV